MKAQKYIVILVGIPFIFVFILIAKTHKYKTSKNQLVISITPTPVETNKDIYKDIVESLKKEIDNRGLRIAAVNPEGSVYAYFTYHEKALQLPRGNVAAHTLMMDIRPLWSEAANDTIANCIIPWYSFPEVYWKQVIEPTHPYLYYIRSLDPSSSSPYSHKTSVITWSHDGLSMAFLSPDTLYIYQFALENNPPARYGTCKKGLVLKNTIKEPFKWPDDRYTPFQMFFSGDDTQLYIAMKTLYQYSIDTQKLESLTLIKDGLHVYPIPESKGVVYPVRSYSKEQGATDGIMIDTGNIQHAYNLTHGHDGIQNIVLSPNHRYVCVEEQSSGSHAYSIFELPSKQLVAKTGTYSYCDRWLDNEQIIVKEAEYDSQAGGSNNILLNVRTGKRTLLSPDYNWLNTILNEVSKAYREGK